jgi:glutamyl-tRNA synthetase
MEEMINKFSLERVNKAGAVFDLQKLNWMNAEHLRKLPDDILLNMFKDELSKSEFKDSSYSDKHLLMIIDSMKERVSFVSEIITNCRYFYEPPKEYEQKSIEKNWKEETPAQLKMLVESFSRLNNPVKEDYEKIVTDTAESLNIGKGKLIHPLRLAVSGQSTGPGMFDLLAILGKDEVIRRINIAIEKIRN